MLAITAVLLSGLFAAPAKAEPVLIALAKEGLARKPRFIGGVFVFA